MATCRKMGIVGVLCAALMLPACSAVKLTYNNASGLVSWWLDDYLDFSEAQQEILRPQLNTLHDWHRQHELPAYTALLEQMQSAATADITPERACEIMWQMLDRIQMLNAQFAPAILAVAPSLSAEQLSHLQAQFDESNEEWREEWMDGTDQERKEYRLEQAIKRAEMFYGNLESGQRDILQAHIAASSFDPAVSYAERLRRQQDAMQTLAILQRNTLTEPQIQAEVAQFFARMADSPDPAYRKYLHSVIDESCTTIADLHNSTSAEQRAQASQKLQDYQADFRLLHQQGNADE